MQPGQIVLTAHTQVDGSCTGTGGVHVFVPLTLTVTCSTHIVPSTPLIHMLSHTTHTHACTCTLPQIESLHEHSSQQQSKISALSSSLEKKAQLCSQLEEKQGNTLLVDSRPWQYGSAGWSHPVPDASV